VAYIEIPIETEPVELADEAFSYIENEIAGWLPAEGNLESVLVESLAQIAAELRALAALVPDSIFAYYGSSILNLPPYPAVAATGLTSWQAIDGGGYTIPAGTLIGITPPASSDTYAFQVVSDFSIPAGSTGVGDIQVQALEPGAAASGLTGAVVMLDSLAFIELVTLQGATSGGQDAEASDAYLNRLADLLTLMSPEPILPSDFAELVQTTIEGVARATAVDLYNPGPPIDANCPRCVSVAICDLNGQPCTPAIKAEAVALLQAQREVNFLAFIIDPTYTTIDVTVVVQSLSGFTHSDVTAAVQAALTSYLSPVNWGVPPYGDPGSSGSWINATTVRYLELAQVVNQVEGVGYISSLTFGVHGGAMGTADVALPGPAPLTEPGTMAVT
jgi:hypothetical protein